MLHIMINGDTGKAYNISNDKCNVHLREFASICAAVAGKEVVFDLPDEVEMRGFSIASQAVLSNDYLTSIDFKASYDIETAISRTISILSDK